ncbi:MAG TPA: ROK family transcriptional regulator [Solirubrobacteraceae bacterium]|nr:ROK family transcriptional regulator [Solirubrobacteraceae bacterium]
MVSGIAEPASPGSVLALIRSGAAMTRNELAERLGVARSTVVQRLGVLTEAGLVRVAGDAQSSGGRPASIFAFDESAGLVLVGDLGQTGCHLAVCDLGARPLAELTASLQIERGPEMVLAWVTSRFSELLAEVGRDWSDVLGIGLGLPGPVDFDTGRPVSPPAMPGWDGVDVPSMFAEITRAPVLVDNDARIMALGEHRAARRADRHMIFVKIGSGIGAGLIAHGEILRGARGAAGDIGHIVVDPGSSEVCRCGNVGCLDAVAGGWAIARRMGDVAPTPPDVVRLAREGHPEATGQVRRSGRLVGVAVADAVNLLNPTSVVIGGKLAEADEQVFAAIREVVYRHATPVASRHLKLVITELGHMAGVIGAAHMVIDHVLEPDRVAELVERRSSGPVA